MPKPSEEAPVASCRSETLPQLRPDELERLVMVFRAKYTAASQAPNTPPVRQPAGDTAAD